MISFLANNEITYKLLKLVGNVAFMVVPQLWSKNGVSKFWKSIMAQSSVPTAAATHF